MRSNELVILHGHVGSDPEMRYLPSGTAVCNFSFAVNKSFKNGEGERVEKTKWFRATAWAGQAEFVNQYIVKGQELLLAGEVDTHAYQASDGQPRASLDFTVREITFCGRRPGNGSANGSAQETESDTELDLE